jgi:hypothetical protein
MKYCNTIKDLICKSALLIVTFFAVQALFIFFGKGEKYDTEIVITDDCLKKECYTEWIDEHRLGYIGLLKYSSRGKEIYLIRYVDDNIYKHAYTNHYIGIFYLMSSLCIITFIMIAIIAIYNVREENNIVTVIPEQPINNNNDVIEQEILEEEVLIDKRLTTFIYDSSKSCSICLNDYYDGEDVSALKCKHIFHSKCISGWIKDNNECPLCKSGNIV